MEPQINKSRLYMDNKEDNDKKKRNIGKKDSFRLPKETFEENDVIIINNVQDFEKDIKNYIEKMEKQLFNHHSLIALQRQKFKEILNKVAIILDQKEINYEKFQKFFKTLNLSSLLNQNKFHGKSNEINASLDGIILEQLKEAETKINGDEIYKEKNNNDNKSVLLIESDTSCKNEDNNEIIKNEPKNLKRGRNANSYNQDKQIKKRKIAPNNINGDNDQDQMDFNHLEGINHTQNFHNNINSNNNFKKIPNGNNNNNNMPFNNFRLMGNYNNFIINDNMEKLNNHDNNNYFLLAQKMMGSNGNFLNSYNEILNNENMFSINKN